MDKLLVATVFAESRYNDKWCDLQKKFLEKTTQNYDLIAYLNRVPPSIISGYNIVGASNGPPPSSFLEMSKEHCHGLNVLLNEFKKNTEYKSLLILDSDAFPIKKWQDVLKERMNNKKAAAAVRFENLTTFPHPSVMFVTREALSWFKIEMGESSSLLSEDIYDTCAGLPLNKFYPLVRTNEWNPHPVYFGVYGHLFYHHACGSRTPHFRADTYYTKQYDVGKYWDKFFISPDHFISRLKGKEELLV